MLNIRQIYNEAVTIPADKAGPIELELRKIFKTRPKEIFNNHPNFHYEDAIIKCCRNDEKSNVNKNELIRIYISGLKNILDLFDVYDKCKNEYIKQKQKKLVNVTGKDKNGNEKTINLHPVNDFGKIGRFSVLKQFITNLETLVSNEEAIPTTFKKYAVTDENRKNIRIICFNNKVAVWGTKTFEASQKFAVQLWQNIDTIDSGAAYGEPQVQCPYCTHAENHWNTYAEGDKNYEQYWYLYLPNGMSGSTGDLTNSSVVKIYNAMKGLGPELLICQNDSNNDWCDYADNNIIFSICFNKYPDDYDDDLDYNFNGGFKHVKELFVKNFKEYSFEHAEMMPWENQYDYEHRISKINKKLLPISDINIDVESKKNHDRINDWQYDIILNDNNLENGKLKFQLPKNVNNLTIDLENNAITDFTGFPDKIYGAFKIYNSRFVLKNGENFACDLSEATVTVAYGNNEVFKLFSQMNTGKKIKSLKFLFDDEEVVNINSVNQIGGIDYLETSLIDLDLSDCSFNNIKHIDIVCANLLMSPATHITNLEKINIYLNDGSLDYLTSMLVNFPSVSQRVTIDIDNVYKPYRMTNEIWSKFMSKFNEDVNVVFSCYNNKFQFDLDVFDGLKFYPKITIQSTQTQSIDTDQRRQFQYIIAQYHNNKGFIDGHFQSSSLLAVKNAKTSFYFSIADFNRNNYSNIFNAAENEEGDIEIVEIRKCFSAYGKTRILILGNVSGQMLSKTLKKIVETQIVNQGSVLTIDSETGLTSLTDVVVPAGINVKIDNEDIEVTNLKSNNIVEICNVKSVNNTVFNHRLELRHKFPTPDGLTFNNCRICKSELHMLEVPNQINITFNNCIFFDIPAGQKTSDNDEYIPYETYKLSSAKNDLVTCRLEYVHLNGCRFITSDPNQQNNVNFYKSFCENTVFDNCISIVLDNQSKLTGCILNAKNVWFKGEPVKCENTQINCENLIFCVDYKIEYTLEEILRIIGSRLNTENLIIQFENIFKQSLGCDANQGFKNLVINCDSNLHDMQDKLEEMIPDKLTDFDCSHKLRIVNAVIPDIFSTADPAKSLLSKKSISAADLKIDKWFDQEPDGSLIIKPQFIGTNKKFQTSRISESEIKMWCRLAKLF